MSILGWRLGRWFYYFSKRGKPLFRLQGSVRFRGCFFTIRHESEGKFVFLGKIHFIKDIPTELKSIYPFGIPLENTYFGIPKSKYVGRISKIITKVIQGLNSVCSFSRYGVFYLTYGPTVGEIVWVFFSNICMVRIGTPCLLPMTCTSCALRGVGWRL